jgi:hypothetical protein
MFGNLRRRLKIKLKTSVQEAYELGEMKAAKQYENCIAQATIDGYRDGARTGAKAERLKWAERVTRLCVGRYDALAESIARNLRDNTWPQEEIECEEIHRKEDN